MCEYLFAFILLQCLCPALLIAGSETRAVCTVHATSHDEEKLVGYFCHSSEAKIFACSVKVPS